MHAHAGAYTYTQGSGEVALLHAHANSQPPAVDIGPPIDVVLWLGNIFSPSNFISILLPGAQ